MSARPRIVAFSGPNGTGYGLWRADGVVDLSRRHADRFPTLRHLFDSGEILQIANQNASADFAHEEIVLRPPIPECANVLCVGVNYPDRAEEYGTNSTAASYPSLFPRFARSFTTHEMPLVRPTVSEQLDYEGEIVLLIGKGGRHIAEKDALCHIGALSLCNEGSVRDWMRHGKFNVTQGKNFDRSGSLGPWLIPYEEEAQIADIRLTTRVNGELRQEDRTSRMLFGFARLINYISTFTTLSPGDVIVTGTPTGAGARHDPPIWLKPGDVIEVEAEGIGLLRNGVVDEAPIA